MESPWGILTGEVMWSDVYFEEITLAAVWRLDYEGEVEAGCPVRRPLLWATTATEPLQVGPVTVNWPPNLPNVVKVVDHLSGPHLHVRCWGIV